MMYPTFRLAGAALALIAAAALGSCATAVKAPAAAAAAPVVAKASGPMVVTDFEDSSVAIITYAGPKSSVKTEYQSAVVHGGKTALKVTENTSDWSGALITLGPDNGNWGAYSRLHFWVYGTKTGDAFNIDLEDAGGEQFRDTFDNDFTGWKEFVVPFTEFPVRGDYQAPDAKRNAKIDWPLKTIQFFTASKFSGFLVFDDLSVEP